MEFFLIIIEKVIWSGIAAVGFGILFNVPQRVLFTIFCIGGLAGFIKFFCLQNNINIILASFFAASLVGIISIPFAGNRHTSPFILSIPSVIPMIPGYYGYKAFVGIIKIVMMEGYGEKITDLLAVMKSGFNMMFILTALTIGISLPWLIFRMKTINKLKLNYDEDYI